MNTKNGVDEYLKDATQVIEIEKGRTVKNIEVSDGRVVINYEDAFCPKDGDFVAGEFMGLKFLSIYKSSKSDKRFNYHVIFGMDNLIRIDDWADAVFCVRMQTESEKQQLLDALAKEGLTWNAEKKVVEKLRFRAHKYDYFWCVNSIGDAMNISENNSDTDKKLFEIGNYFRTEQEAKKAADGLKQYFAQYK